VRDKERDRDCQPLLGFGKPEVIASWSRGGEDSRLVHVCAGGVFVEDLWIVKFEVPTGTQQSRFGSSQGRMILDREVSGPCRGRGKGSAS
jgi:hypothetical protein